jgi:hypothetical protein
MSRKPSIHDAPGHHGRHDHDETKAKDEAHGRHEDTAKHDASTPHPEAMTAGQRAYAADGDVATVKDVPTLQTGQDGMPLDPEAVHYPPPPSDFSPQPEGVPIPPPLPTEPPELVDVPFASQTGAVLNCTMGNWNNEPTSYAYQWRKDGVLVEGATAADHTVTTADADTVFACEVTASNAKGSATVTSNDVTVTDPDAA